MGGTSMTYVNEANGGNRCTDSQMFTPGSSCYDCFTTGNSCADCEWTQSSGYKTTIASLGYTPGVNIIAQTRIGGFCPERKGTWSHNLQYPQWQECCVEYASLQHPGVPYP